MDILIVLLSSLSLALKLDLHGDISGIGRELALSLGPPRCK